MPTWVIYQPDTWKSDMTFSGVNARGNARPMPFAIDGHGLTMVAHLPSVANIMRRLNTKFNGTMSQLAPSQVS